MGKRLSLIFGLLAASAWAEDPESDFSQEAQHGGKDTVVEEPAFAPDPALLKQLKAQKAKMDTPRPTVIKGGVVVKQEFDPAQLQAEKAKADAQAKLKLAALVEKTAEPKNFEVSCEGKRFTLEGDLKTGHIHVGWSRWYQSEKYAHVPAVGMTFRTKNDAKDEIEKWFPKLAPDVGSLTENAEAVHLRGAAIFSGSTQRDLPARTPDFWYEFVSDNHGNFYQINVTIPQEKFGAQKGSSKFPATLQVVKMHWTKGHGAKATSTETEKATCTVTSMAAKK
jgi:hypothetical protein